MKKEIIRVENLSLAYEESNTSILQDVSFSIHEQESILVLGPSGSGKSSLLHCMNGVYPGDLDGHMEGSVFIHGKKSSDYNPGEIPQQIGVVFQDPETQFCMLTVEEEVAFGLENLCIVQDKMAAKIEEVLTWVGLESFKEETIGNLSGGQKQKLALACVLAMEPKVLLLDEPTANLDPEATKEFIDLLSRLKKQHTVTMIVIEHQLEGWLEILNRVIVLSRKGTVYFDGPLQEGLRTYAKPLHNQGVCLPFATRAALEGGREDQLPLTLEEYTDKELPCLPYQVKTTTRRDVVLEAIDLAWKGILSSIDLTIRNGEWIAIAGANGSGKTSLSKVLSGIVKPSYGEVLLHEKPLDKWKALQVRSEIGYVFQNPEHQFITDSVFEEVAFSLKLAGETEDKIKKMVKETLKACQLEGLEHRHPFNLSQGQKRRLSVATMIVDDQRILFLDEPTFGQDSSSTEGVMKILQKKHQQGTTIVMITHDMELVDKFATRVVVMENRRIALDESPKKLWKRENLKKHHLIRPDCAILREMWNERRHADVSS